MLTEIGKLVIGLGSVIVVIGIILVLAERIPWLGRLPGDIRIETGNFSCMFPLATSILLSIVLTIVLNLILRVLNR